jgi:hypothetical protein
MNEAQMQLLSLGRQLPARLNADEVAHLLNCQAHDIPLLVAKKLLKPLGNPPPNSVKYFATADLVEFMRDRTWLARMTSAIYQHWQHQNARRKNRTASITQNGALTPSFSKTGIE